MTASKRLLRWASGIMLVLGCLIWHLAGRGIAVPAGIGWGLAASCLAGGVLLVPSPYFAGVVSGALIILAARKEDRLRHQSRQRTTTMPST